MKKVRIWAITLAITLRLGIVSVPVFAEESVGVTSAKSETLLASENLETVGQTKEDETQEEITQVELKSEIEENGGMVSRVALGSVTNLKAVSAGKCAVKLTWNNVAGAEGYLIYAQKDGKYGYVGITTRETTFTDVKALDSDYNFYWVFPYVMNNSDKMIPGGCEKYVYAKGVCKAVNNLKTYSVTNGVKLTWSFVHSAEGYLIYGMNGANNAYHYIGMTNNTSFIDTKASASNWNFYWVFPYHKDSNGKMIVGETAKYVYGKPITQVKQYVYWVSGGKSYHYSKDCTTLKRSKVILEGTLDEALAQGKIDPCNLCANGK